ncbi:hypothetical protein MMC21_000578 [Puttea exsequens]|nr:hypothetical protein [Puttea exsequens]
MAPLPIDISMTGYVPGTVDGKNDIYRNRKRLQPYPLVQNDSGYESTINSHSSSLPSLPSPSFLSLASFVKCSELLNNESNFSSSTAVECYEGDGHSIKHHLLDESGFDECLASLAAYESDECKHRVLLFFPKLDLEQNASYKARSSFSKTSVENLVSSLGLSTLFIPNLLGWPNYWSPELYSTFDSSGTLETVDFFCQYPRFAIHGPGFKQRLPVSIYMRYDATKNLTYYIVSAPESEEFVKNFQSLIDLVCNYGKESAFGNVLLRHPLETHILLSKLSCESSQGFINLFRQSMFAQACILALILSQQLTKYRQLRAVDELSAQETADRKGLADVTIELQIISKDVNKLISDVDVALRNLTKMQEAFERLDQSSSGHATTPPTHRQQLGDTLQYLHSSMDKQKMWLHNYRDRKDIAMSLVFNLVTQQDAANNISIAKDMKRDSSSMNGIALLTMVFLPGTFTSTILGAGLYSAVAHNNSIHVSGLWWFWAAITFPLTGLVLILWGVFCWRQELQLGMGRLLGGIRWIKGDDIEAKG